MRRTGMVVAGVAIVAILAIAAAFVAGRFVKGQGVAAKPTEKGPVVYSAEMPPRQPDFYGALLRHQDSSLIVCKPSDGNLSVSKDGAVIENANPCDGPELQIVVGHDARVYHDITAQQYVNRPLVPGETIQQMVEPGSLSEITTSSRMDVWGQRTGDRMVAEVVVYWIPGGGN